MACLRIRDSSILDCKTFPLQGAIVRIGRTAGNEIPLDHHGISREHAVITHEKPGYYITDLGSRNGTYVNGRPISEKTKLANGDLLRFCDLELVFFERDVPYDDSFHLSESSIKQRQNAEQLKRITLADTDPEDGYAVKSKIILNDKRPVLTSAKASVKLKAMLDIGRNLGAAIDQVLPQLIENLLKIFPQAD